MASPFDRVRSVAQRLAGADLSTIDAAPLAKPIAVDPNDPRGAAARTGLKMADPATGIAGMAGGLDADASATIGRLNRRLWAAADSVKAGDQSDPILRLVRRLPGMGAEHATKLLLYETLRETLPVLNAAILKRRFIEGDLEITSDDPGLARALNDFAESVPVQNYAVPTFQTGLDVWLDFCSENADALGLGIGEVVIEDGQVARLVAPHPRTFYWKESRERTGEDGSARDRDVWKLFQRRKTGTDQEIDSPLVKILAFSADPASPWGRPVAWGLPFVAEILIRIFVSLNNLWHRVGDPSQLYQIIYRQRQDGSFPGTKEVDADAALLDELLQAAYRLRAQGKTADVVMGMADAEIKGEALGGNVIVSSLAPYLQAHYQAVAGQVIANADVPPWMFPAGIVPADGLNSNRAEVEGGMALGAGRTRNVRRAKLAKFVLDQFLVYDGSASRLGRYLVGFRQPDLADPKVAAEARAANMNADATAIDNALLLGDSGIFEDDQDREGYLTRNGVLVPRR